LTAYSHEDLVFSKLTVDHAIDIICGMSITVEPIGKSDYYKLTDDDGDWDDSHEMSSDELREYAFEKIDVDSYCTNCGLEDCECCCDMMNQGCSCEEESK
tara:strand:+ start:267 stop:566 length:300 start_codon:yes stop_codon:yes gene_type:complete